MKRMRIFLGIALVGVAIAAAAATTVKKVDVTYYYQLSTSCPSIVIPDPVCNTTSSNNCTTSIDGTSTPLFLARSATDATQCVTPLKKQ